MNTLMVEAPPAEAQAQRGVQGIRDRACQQPGVSMAAIALANGLNATMLRKWVTQAEQQSGTAPRGSPGRSADDRFRRRAAGRAGQPRRADIRIEVQRGATSDGELARSSGVGLRCLAARLASVIRVDAIWLATEPLDMRAGTDTALARVVSVFGSCAAASRVPLCQPPRQPHEGACARRRGHLAGRAPAAPGPLRLGRAWQRCARALTREQLDALVLGLPWHRIGERGVIGLL